MTAPEPFGQRNSSRENIFGNLCAASSNNITIPRSIEGGRTTEKYRNIGAISSIRLVLKGMKSDDYIHRIFDKKSARSLTYDFPIFIFS